MILNNREQGIFVTVFLLEKTDFPMCELNTQDS